MSRQRRIVMAARDYGAYVRSLTPTLWLRLNELSGSVAVNSGSLGAAYNGAYTSCTLAQAGKMSPTGAVLFDGAISRITIPAGPFGNQATMTTAVLVNMNTAGEGSIGTFMDWATTTVFRFNLSLASLRSVRASGTPGQSNTNAGVNATSWTWLFWTYQDTGDRKVHLYKGIAGALSEYGYSTQTANAGAMTDQSAVALILGNVSGQSRTLDGLCDEFLLFNGLLTPAQMQQIVRLTGV